MRHLTNCDDEQPLVDAQGIDRGRAAASFRKLPSGFDQVSPFLCGGLNARI
jgi:hypothetical protein